MLLRRISPSAFVSSCLLTGVLFSTGGGAAGEPARPNDVLALRQLVGDFHGSGTYGDVERLRSIWTEDAVFRGGGNVVVGRDQIVAFFTSNPDWGRTCNMSPTYKTTYDIRGNTALLRFECLLVRVQGSDPASTPLSSLPPGSQNPNVEIIQHSNASVMAVKRGRRWLIQAFDGAGGPIL